MRLHADSYFTIGSAHVTAGKPAQDYAMTGVDGDSVVAVVSDGCSTGGRTDVGARIVALATIQAATTPEVVIFPEQRRLMTQVRDTLGLQTSDLLATCLYMNANRSTLYFNLSGDGVAAMKRRDGSMLVHRIDWKNNIPFYPAYLLDDTKGETAFFAAHGGAHSESVNIETISYSESFLYTQSALDGSRGTQFIAGLGEIEFAAVFSDGVTQIENVDWKDAVVELMSFKNTAGEFVKRRAMAALRGFRERGKGPVDDFSMAAIWVDHE